MFMRRRRCISGSTVFQTFQQTCVESGKKLRDRDNEGSIKIGWRYAGQWETGVTLMPAFETNFNYIIPVKPFISSRYMRKMQLNSEFLPGSAAISIFETPSHLRHFVYLKQSGVHISLSHPELSFGYSHLPFPNWRKKRSSFLSPVGCQLKKCLQLFPKISLPPLPGILYVPSGKLFRTSKQEIVCAYAFQATPSAETRFR